MFGQLIYTSCKTGIKNKGTGFQVYSYSASMSSEIVEEIQKHCSYKAPYSLPLKPTDEDIDRLFPVSFKYTPISSDRKMCFIRNKYIGQDYMGGNGRYGIYITHAVESDAENIDFHPISAILSKRFIDNLTFEEKNSDVCPGYLPEISKEEIFSQNYDAVMLSKTRDFLFESPERLENLKSLIDAFITSQSDKNRIVICDDKENIPFWIAAVTVLLPVEFAKEVTFDTYVSTPQYSFSKLMGIFHEKSNYNFDELSGACYIFDFKTGKTRESSRKYKYSEFLCDAFTLSEDEANEFNVFLSDVIGNCSITDTIDDYLNLFEFCTGKCLLSDETVSTIIGIAEKTDVRAVKKAVFDGVVSNMDEIFSVVSSVTARSVFEFVSKNELEFSACEEKVISQQIFVEFLISFIFSNDEEKQKDADLFYDEYAEVVYGEEAGFLSELFEGKNGERVSALLKGNKNYFTIQFFADKMFKYFVSQKAEFYAASKKSDLIGIVVNNVLENYRIEDSIFSRAIALSDGDCEYSGYLLKSFVELLKVSDVICDKTSAVNEVVLKHLSLNASLKNAVWVIKILHEFDCTDSAFGISSYAIGLYGKDFLRELSEVQEIKEYVTSNSAFLVNEYLAVKSPDADELMEFIIDFWQRSCFQSEMEKLFMEFDKKILVELPLRYDKEKLRTLLQIKDNFKITFKGRFEALIDILRLKMSVENKSEEELWNDVKKIRLSGNLEKADAKDLKKLAEYFIPLLCQKVSCYDDQEEIVALFGIIGVALVVRMLTENIMALPETVGQMLMLDNFNVICQHGTPENPNADNISFFASEISKLPKEKFEQLGAKAEMAFCRDDAVKQAWNDMYLPVSEKKNATLGNKILNIFKSNKKKNENDIIQR